MPIAALILGILGLVCLFVPLIGFYITVVLCLLATVLGVLGRKSARAANGPTSIATAGMVVGIIGLALGSTIAVACTYCYKKLNDGATALENDPSFKKAMEEGFKNAEENVKKREAVEKKAEEAK